MYRFHNNSPVHDIPFKTEIPCMEYDFAVFCKRLKETISIPLPLYMEEFKSFLDYYPTQVKKLKPSRFPDGTRIYIIDNRLNFIFATIDNSGSIRRFFRHYAQHGRHLEDYTFGDENTATTPLDSPGKRNYAAQLKIKKEYDTLPLDELTMPAVLFFEQEFLKYYHPISFFQACSLMEKYRSENYIDWNALVDQLNADYYTS